MIELKIMREQHGRPKGQVCMEDIVKGAKKRGEKTEYLKDDPETLRRLGKKFDPSKLGTTPQSVKTEDDTQ